MLERFSASNFKSIKSLDIPLSPFMVLVGPNGAGKTNFVQALELFGAILERGTIEPVRELGYDELIRREKKPARAGLQLGATFRSSHRQVSKLRRTAAKSPEADREFLLTVRFGVRGSVRADQIHLDHEELRFEAGSNHLSIKIKGSGTTTTFDGDSDFADLVQLAMPVLTRGLDVQSGDFKSHLEKRVSELGEEFGSGWLIVPRLVPRPLASEAAVTRIRLDASTLRSDALTSERRRSYIGPAGEGLALAVDRLRGHDSGKTSPRFQALMRQLNEVYPRIEDVVPVRVQPGRLALTFKERGISDPLGQTNVSDGVLHALAILLAVNPAFRSHGILAVEEPENAVHPWPLRRIIQGAQGEASRMLVITTHSPVVVDAIANPDSLFVVEQTDEDGTTITPARDKEEAIDSILRDSGKKLGELWTEGGLGGVPTAE